MTSPIQRAHERSGRPTGETNDGWTQRFCSCCGGLEWGGEPPPRECRHCHGNGAYWTHDATGTHAAWPGGPFVAKRRMRPAREVNA